MERFTALRARDRKVFSRRRGGGEGRGGRGVKGWGGTLRGYKSHTAEKKQLPGLGCGRGLKEPAVVLDKNGKRWRKTGVKRKVKRR